MHSVAALLRGLGLCRRGCGLRLSEPFNEIVIDGRDGVELLEAGVMHSADPSRRTSSFADKIQLVGQAGLYSWSAADAVWEELGH